MNIELARRVIRTAFRSSRELEDLLQLLKTHCSDQEYKDFSLGIASAIDGINVALLDKIYAAHPELEKEVEASIAKYNCYL